jgi:hypothetical protein
MTKNETYADTHTAIDVLCVAFMFLLFFIGMANPSRVQDWPAAGRNLVIAAILYCAASAGVRLLRGGLASTWALTALVTLLLSFLFQAVEAFQHVFIRGWLDGSLIAWERGVTGTESTLFLQRVTSPLLTEWLMFAYVIYVPLLPVTALLCFRRDGQKGARDFLFNLAMANFACFTGFLLFPVAGPLFYDPGQYSVQLTGGFFTWCGRMLHATSHYPGGSLPSPHCAATTVMLVMLYRHNRNMFYVALPTLISIYAATVYGRYHYAWDSAAGIVTALIVLKISPAVLKSLVPAAQQSLIVTTNRMKGEQS